MPSTLEAAFLLALRESVDELRDRLDKLLEAKASTDQIVETERRAISDALAELQSELDEVN